MYIAIEGIDGSGKTTLIQLLGERLMKHPKNKHQSINYLNLNNPGGPGIGQKIRALFKDTTPRGKDVDFLLLAANRMHNARVARDFIREHENDERETVVVCDRCDISTHVYQNHPTVGLLKDRVYWVGVPLHDKVNDYPEVDLVAYLDVDMNRSLKQIKKRREEEGETTETDRYEANLENHTEWYKDVGHNYRGLLCSLIEGARKDWMSHLHDWQEIIVDEEDKSKTSVVLKTDREYFFYRCLPHTMMNARLTKHLLRFPMTLENEETLTLEKIADYIADFVFDRDSLVLSPNLSELSENEKNAIDTLDQSADYFRALSRKQKEEKDEVEKEQQSTHSQEASDGSTGSTAVSDSV